MKKIKAGLVALAAAAATMLPVSTAHASTAYQNIFNWNSWSSWKCLVVQADGSHGSRASQYDCAGYRDQLWNFQFDGAPHEIRNLWSDQCLTVQGYSPGAPAFDYQCTGLVDQKWYSAPINNYPGRYWLVNENSGQCLVIQGTSNGNEAFQYPCSNYTDQYWGHTNF